MRGERMRIGLVTGGLLVCAVGLLGGCASSSVTPAGDARSRSSSATVTSSSLAAGGFTYLGPISTSSSLDGGDIQLDVPPVDDVAAASPQKAFASCGNGAAVCTTLSTATMRLALVTTTAAGTAGPNGSINPLINNALTYVIEWNGVPCQDAGGPPQPSGSPQPTVTAKSCHLVDFVSAATGTYLYAFESPR